MTTTMNKRAFLAGYMLKYAEEPSAMSPGAQKLWGGDVIPTALQQAGVKQPAGGFSDQYKNFYMNELGNKGVVPSLINPDNKWAAPGMGGAAGAAIGGLMGGAEGMLMGGLLGAIAGWIAENFFPGQLQKVREWVRDWHVKGQLEKNLGKYEEAAVAKNIAMGKDPKVVKDITALNGVKEAVAEYKQQQTQEGRVASLKDLDESLKALNEVTVEKRLDRELPPDKIASAYGMGAGYSPAVVSSIREKAREAMYKEQEAYSKYQVAKGLPGYTPDKIDALYKDWLKADSYKDDSVESIMNGSMAIPDRDQLMSTAQTEDERWAISETYRNMASNWDAKNKRLAKDDGRSLDKARTQDQATELNTQAQFMSPEDAARASVQAKGLVTSNKAHNKASDMFARADYLMAAGRPEEAAKLTEQAKQIRAYASQEPSELKRYRNAFFTTPAGIYGTAKNIYDKNIGGAYSDVSNKDIVERGISETLGQLPSPIPGLGLNRFSKEPYQKSIGYDKDQKNPYLPVESERFRGSNIARIAGNKASQLGKKYAVPAPTIQDTPPITKKHLLDSLMKSTPKSGVARNQTVPRSLSGK